jgi:hypothetical protein
VRTRSKPDYQKPRIRIPERRHRLAPILPIKVSPALHPRNILTMLDKPWTKPARDNLVIETAHASILT